MGGNAFGHVKPIDINTYNHSSEVLFKHLNQIGFSDIKVVGSTGKKRVMGDLDYAARPTCDVEKIVKQACGLFGQTNVKKSGGSTVSIAYPFPNLLTRDFTYVQVDVMMGDPHFLEWSRWGSSNDPSHHDFSLVKGSVRNVFLGTVMWWVTRELLPEEQGELDRVRYVLDYDHGLQKLWQTLRNKRDDRPPNKNWRTTDREQLSSDPDYICKFITGESDTSSVQMLTLRSIVKCLRTSKRFCDKTDAIIDDFCERLADADTRVVGNLEETINNVRLEVTR